MKRQEIKDLLTCDTLGKNKNGNYVAKWSYFYRHGESPEKYAASVLKAIPNAVIVGQGDHYVDGGRTFLV